MSAKSPKKRVAKKKPQQNIPTLVMLVQQIKPEYWAQAATDPVFAAMLDEAHAANAMEPKDDPARIERLQAAADAIGGYVVENWEEDGCEVVDAHAILHGDDAQKEWSETDQCNIEVRKFLHIHLLVKFGSRAKSKPVSRLGALAGVPANQISIGGKSEDSETATKGGAMVTVCGQRISQQHDNGLAYLVHVKYPTEKYQYQPKQVASVRGMDYMQVYRERIEEWRKGIAHIKKKRALLNVEDLREKVLGGEVTKSQILLTDELFETYSRHQRVIDDAFEAYAQRRAMIAAMKLMRGEFSTQVVFIHGESGAGKTRFATDFIGTMIGYAFEHGERWELYRAATGNPLDDWRGEEVMLLDDLRASAMDANDWLLLLDPHNASPARARYRNKQAVAPRLIIITATIEPVEFFFYARKKGEVDEALDQFIRRLASIVKVIRADDVNRYLVQSTGRVDPYQRRVVTSNGVEQFALGYGVTGEVEHSSEGATAALLMGLAERSRDVPFATGGAWPALETLHAVERTEHGDRLIEAARVWGGPKQHGDAYAAHYRAEHLGEQPGYICGDCLAITQGKPVRAASVAVEGESR